MVELVIIAVYFFLMIAIGLISRRKAKGADDFFVAGRKGTSVFIVGSLIATIVGGSATIGMAGMGFSLGLNGAWWLLSGSIGLIALGIFFARKVREYGLYTLPELVEKLYDKRVAFISSILIIIAWIGIIAGQIVAAGRIMSILGMGSPELWMILFTAIFTIYTLLGGQHAILRTDTLQSVVIFGGIFASLALVLSHVGGIDGMTAVLTAEHFSFGLNEGFGGYDLAKLLLLVGLTYVVGPDIYSRLFCAKDGRVARNSVFWVAILAIPFAFAITMIGMSGAVLFPDIAAEQAFPTVIKEILPPFANGIVLAALLCAVMSSADTCLLSASTILTMDIYKKFKPSLTQDRILVVSRWGILVIGLCSLLLALALKGVISSLLFAYTIYTAGLTIPVIIGFYKKRLKVTSLGALAAVIGGGVSALISKLANIEYLDLGSLLISIFLLFAVSYIERKVKPDTALGRSTD